MSIGAIATYTSPENPFLPQLLAIVAIFTVIGIPSAMVWTAFGKAIRRFLNTSARQRIFNVVMGALMLLSVIPTLLDIAKGFS